MLDHDHTHGDMGLSSPVPPCHATETGTRANTSINVPDSKPNESATHKDVSSGISLADTQTQRDPPESKPVQDPQDVPYGLLREMEAPQMLAPVSYTHLTLPTKA